MKSVLTSRTWVLCIVSQLIPSQKSSLFCREKQSLLYMDSWEAHQDVSLLW